MAETGEMEDYQSLTRTGKVKRVLPKVLPLLLLSVILPTADVGTDLALITKLYRGLKAECVRSEGIQNCLRFRSHHVSEARVSVISEHLLPDDASVSGGAMSVKENTY